MNQAMFKKVRAIVLAAIITIVVVVLVSGGFYTINEEEQAVITTLGRAEVKTEAGGPYFKIPFIQRVTKVNTKVQGFEMGYRSRTEEEEYTDEMATQESVEAESLMITSDYNFINVDFYGEFKVSDPVKFLYASENPIGILKNVTQHSIRTVIGSYTVDSVLTTGKSEIQSNIKSMIIEKMEELDVGIQLTNLTIQDAEPPTEEVIQAFKAVENAKQSKDTALNNANKYANEKIPAAKASVDKILQDAQAQQQSRINEAEGQVARFNSMYEEYKKYPLITKQRMFYEAMEELLPNMKIIIEGSNEINQMLPLESFATIENTTTTVESEVE